MQKGWILQTVRGDSIGYWIIRLRFEDRGARVDSDGGQQEEERKEK